MRSSTAWSPRLGGKLNFDVLSIHPYMPDRMPESTDPKTVVQNFPYRLDMSYKWLQAHNATNKEIWITEDGYSTCTDCGTLGVSEEEQAVRLDRLYVIAMASPGVTQFDYFQLKDKFNAGQTDLWGNMGIMRNDMSQKPAYKAYKVMTGQLKGATFSGLGPLTRAVHNRWQTQYRPLPLQVHPRRHHRPGNLETRRCRDGQHARSTANGHDSQHRAARQSHFTRQGDTMTFSISEDPVYVE